MKTYSSDILRTNPVGCLGVSWRGTHRSRKMPALGRGRGIPGLGSGVESSRAGNLLMNSTVNTDVFFFTKWSLEHILQSIFLRDAFPSKWLGNPPKWQVLYTELRGSRCPVPRSRRTPGWFFAPWGLLGSTRQKTLGDVHLHRVTKNNICNRCTLRKTWNLGISICIWRHQLQDFNA